MNVDGDGSTISDTEEPIGYSLMDDMFSHPQRDAKKAQSPSSSEYQQNELSKITAKVWNKMHADERNPFVEEAKNEKEWYEKMYPDCDYRAPIEDGQKMKSFKVNPSWDCGRADEMKEAAPNIFSKALQQAEVHNFKTRLCGTGQYNMILHFLPSNRTPPSNMIGFGCKAMMLLPIGRT